MRMGPSFFPKNNRLPFSQALDFKLSRYYLSGMKDWEKFKALLDEHYSWPQPYKFKFIVPAHKKDEAAEILNDHDLDFRPSRTGKYTSVTAVRVFHETDQVIEVYQRVSKIDGLISL